MNFAITVLIALTFFVSQVLLSDELEIIYPSKETEADIRDDDIVELLKIILQRTVETDGDFTMRTAPMMNEARFTKFLKKGKQLNIIWTSATPELDKQSIPIHIPIRKGILGYRIFLIDKKNQAKFENINSLEELKVLTVGQEHFWNDVEVFKANGFQVIKGGSYEGLFNMLIRGRFDYFSRGFNEAYKEYEMRKQKFPSLFVEQNILLYYPWPKFFYVSLNHPKIADRVKRGFKLIIADGTYEQWFLKYNQEAIKQAKLSQRKLFKLNNPLLPSSVPLNQKDLWYDPFR